MAAVGMIVLAGAVVFGAMTAFLAWGQAGTAVSATSKADYNAAGSFGITGLPTLTIKANTAPTVVADALNQNRGIILLAYVAGAADDDDMLASFNAIKAKYAAQASFFSFEAADVSQLGNMLDQLHVSAPPILAVIRGDGTVYQLYTGWIGEQVMDQVVANAIRL
jgi:protein-disulfide isomerase-like protein with CxxC motif